MIINDCSKCFVAPMQGLTTMAWRRAHRLLFPGATYIAPFLRIERGELRNRDLRDLDPVEDHSDTIPQLIASGSDEFRRLVDAVVPLGFTRINLNAGCPHPPQLSRHRGAALLLSPDRLQSIASAMEGYPALQFSLKLRLGVDDPGQWRDAIDIVNAMPLAWVAVHGRVARQGYDGQLDVEAMHRFCEATTHPVIYNGDICSPDHVSGLSDAFSGVMIGRGLISRPALFQEIVEPHKASTDPVNEFLAIHDSLLQSLSTRLQGDQQLLSHLFPYWQLLAQSLPPRSVKEILKSRTLSKYLAAVARFSSTVRSGS